MPLINLFKVALLAMTLTILLSGIVLTPSANAARLPDCRAQPKCLVVYSIDWKSLTADQMQDMIKEGADVKATGKSRITALHLTAKHGNAEIVPVLVNAGADINATNGTNWTPLHFAAFYRKPQVIPTLLKAGANSSAKDNQGKTPLDVAKATKNRQAIKVLESLKCYDLKIWVFCI